MPTPVFDVIGSPWSTVFALSLPFGLAMAIGLIVSVFSGENKRAPHTLREVLNQENRLLSNRQLLALVATIGLVGWLIWVCISIPPDAEAISPMLELMNF